SMKYRATFALAALGVVIGGAAAQPSFDCRKAATPSEKAICAHERLARLDRAIAAAFRQLKAELSAAHDKLPAEQAAFLAERDKCGADESCLARIMESRRAALALEPEKGSADRREQFVGRYKSSIGLVIVRRTLAGEYEFIGSTAGPNARWVCDVAGTLGETKTNVSVVEAGEADESYPVRLTLRDNVLVLAEERPLAGYLCGHNG